MDHLLSDKIVNCKTNNNSATPFVCIECDDGYYVDEINQQSCGEIWLSSI